MIHKLFVDAGKNQIFSSEQVIPRPLHEVFSFFSDAHNLETITPPWLHFKVISCSTPQIETGSLINYRLSLYGIPFSWQSRIEDWKINEQFVDTQVKGPYRYWHHTHSFQALDASRTLMKDTVLYRLPFGSVGAFLSGWKVRRQVNDIFSYRREVIERLF